MADRAVQALHLLGLMPIAETSADPHSYGFRPQRSTADAIEQCFTLLARKDSPQWILEGDIKACFDCISHDWLRDHIPQYPLGVVFFEGLPMSSGKTFDAVAGSDVSKTGTPEAQRIDEAFA
jgi:hypothetical protein